MALSVSEEMTQRICVATFKPKIVGGRSLLIRLLVPHSRSPSYACIFSSVTLVQSHKCKHCTVYT